MGADSDATDSERSEDARIAALKRRRSLLDLVWIVGLVIAPGPVFITVTNDVVFWWMGLSLVLITVGGAARSRATRAIWAADPANAPPGWTRTWLRDLDDEPGR